MAVGRAEVVRDALLAAYGDGARGYHDLRHLTEVLDRLDEPVVERRAFRAAAGAAGRLVP